MNRLVTTCLQTWNNLCVFTCREHPKTACLRQPISHFCIMPYTHVKTHELLQICKQVVTRLLSRQYQDVFALLVPSCCDKSGTSCYHLVTRLMTVINLLQVVPTRLVQGVRNKLLRACCHQPANNLLRADLLEQLVASLLASSTLLQDDNNLFQTCNKVGTSS